MSTTTTKPTGGDRGLRENTHFAGSDCGSRALAPTPHNAQLARPIDTTVAAVSRGDEQHHDTEADVIDAGEAPMTGAAPKAPNTPPSVGQALTLLIEDGARALQKIADAEGLEAQCQRARNAEGIFRAMGEKINEQAKYIVLRDAATAIVRKSNAGPGRGHKGEKQISSTKLAFPQGDPGNVIAHKWRKTFCHKVDGKTEIDPEKVKLALEDAARRAIRICEREKDGTVRGAEGTNDDEWFTPAQYIALARLVLGTIDLDPATHEDAQKIIQAKIYYTKQTDGLLRDWFGQTFLNPPYSPRLIRKFINKLLMEWDSGRITACIVLTHNYTETRWFQKILGGADSVCFPRRRVKFLKPNGEKANPTQGQAFSYFGPDVELFERVFGRIGKCVRPSRGYQDSEPVGAGAINKSAAEAPLAPGDPGPLPDFPLRGRDGGAS